MNTKKHILIISSELYQTGLQPLGGIFQRHEAELLNKNGYQVGVLSVGIITPRYLFKNTATPLWEVCNGVNIIRKYKQTFIPNRINQSNSARDLFISYGLECYVKYVDKFGCPDIIHAHNLKYASLLAYEIKLKFGISYIITEHSSSFIRYKREADNLGLFMKAIRAADCFSTVSRSLADSINEIVESKNLGSIENTTILYNLLDYELLKYVKNDVLNLNKHEPFTFINVASLDDNKNQIIILKAFESKFKGKPFSLKIVGSGKNLKFLRKMANKLGIDEQVSFLGHLSRGPLFQEFKSSNCFVLSSKVETFGVVLIEAAAFGLPLISTRCGGPEEIINKSNGLLVENDNAEVLSQAMLAIAQNYYEYDKFNIQKNALKKYGGSDYLDVIRGIFNS